MDRKRTSNKINTESMNAQYLIKNRKKILRRKRQIKKIKRTLIVMVILCGVLITLGLKLPVFNITNINVDGNFVVSKENIIADSNIFLGDNIFTLSTKQAKNNVIRNSYVLDAEVKRKLPNEVNIIVEEREAQFYTYYDNQYLIMDNQGIILEKKLNIDDMNLLQIKGFDCSNINLGESIFPPDDQRPMLFLNELYELLKSNKSELKISIIDLSNMSDINLYCGSMNIRIGDYKELKSKLNTAFNIIISQKLLEKKGYIDISSGAYPVVFIE